VGIVLDALKENGLNDNTIVVFTSDHGYHMGEHGHWQKTTLFENAARVPLVIAAPGASRTGATVKTPAEMVDFYPTLAELCGLKPPAGLPGVSLAATLNDASAAPRTAALTQYSNGYSICTPRYRYTEWGNEAAGGRELYDHETDPAELKNLAADQRQQKRISELSALLRRHVAHANKKLPVSASAGSDK